MVPPQQRLPGPGQQQFRLPMQDGQSATGMTEGQNHMATLGTGSATGKPRFIMKGMSHLFVTGRPNRGRPAP